MSPSNQTWRTTPPKASQPKVLRITSIPPTSSPAPTPQTPIEDNPYPPRRWNRFNGTANVPPRPDYFVSERHFYFKLLEEKINIAPLPPLPPKIEYGETIPWPEWRPKTPPREGKPGIRLPYRYWCTRFRSWATKYPDDKLVTYYEFAHTDTCWSEMWKCVPMGEGRFSWRSNHFEYWRSMYFKPIVRPVWEWEYAFVGNGWKPDG